MSSTHRIQQKQSGEPYRLRTWLVLWTLLGTGLRMGGLFTNTFHPDEALFATWARFIATWQDPLLMGQLVDKPPLLFYLQAIFYPMFGPVEFAARMPNLVASILTIPLAGALTWRLFRDERSALFAAAFTTLSPLLIQFGSTSFLDPLMTALILSSLLSASVVGPFENEPSVIQERSNRRRASLSGLFFGLALATKYQALLALPFIIVLLVVHRWERRYWLRWLAGAATIVLLLIIWDLVRSGAPGILGSQLSAYGGIRLSWSWELAARLETWIFNWRYLTGSAALSLFLLSMVPVLFISAAVRRDRNSTLDQLLALYISAYLLLHWLLGVPIWDRYLVLIVPFVAIMSSRVIIRLLDYVKNNTYVNFHDVRNSPVVTAAIMVIILLAQVPGTFAAYQGKLDIGGSQQADLGLGTLARTLAYEPPGTVLYDHWNSWQWRYHLYDSNVYLSWFPHPEALVEDLRVFGRSNDNRYVSLPDSVEALPVLRALHEAGFETKLMAPDPTREEEIALRLYRVVTP